uniref:Uncharacterized protein n=1 Tax=Leptocylindrus danicus TaxID=163516 RepID=A0A7S2L8H8_9STRA
MNIRNRNIYRSSQEQRCSSQEALPKSFGNGRKQNGGKETRKTQYIIGFAALTLLYLMLLRSYLEPDTNVSYHGKGSVIGDSKSNGDGHVRNVGKLGLLGSYDETTHSVDDPTGRIEGRVPVAPRISSPNTGKNVVLSYLENKNQANKNSPKIATRVTGSMKNVKHYGMEQNTDASNYIQDHVMASSGQNPRNNAKPILERNIYHKMKNDGLQMMKDAHHERSLEKVAIARKEILDNEAKRARNLEDIIAVDSSDEQVNLESLPGLCNVDDAFANTPISGNNPDSGWEPPVDASPSDKEKWKATYSLSINRIRSSRVGGEALRKFVRNEVATLKRTRHELFCRKPGGLRANAH